MFLQINEPKNSKPKVLGIDLGTTHSLVAVAEEGQIKVLKEHGSVLLPSVVHYQSSGQVIVGKKAYEQYQDDTQDTIRSTKRMLGKSLKDTQHLNNPHLTEKDNQVAYQTSAGVKTPIEVSSEILKSLYHRALNHITGNIQGAVITVPAYFDEAQRLATKHAAKLAGINVLRLINEPTAAAIAYGLQDQAQGLCLVFDLGGGTFDVTLLKIHNGVFHVIATGGDSELGGDDMDGLIVESIFENLQHSEFQEAILIAKQAKELLSNDDETSFSFKGQNFSLTRDKLNEVINPIVQQCIKITQQVLRDADKNPEDLDEVILVGGSTKVPLVQQQLKDLVKQDLLSSLDPEQVVVQGAASHAQNLVGDIKQSLLIDVIPLSLGLETLGGVVEKILMRNSPIPAQAKQTFTTYENNQTGMIFHVVQGERELSEDNRSLATFILKDIPLMPKGHAKVEVTFQVDEEGLLTVYAKELTTGKQTQIEIKPTYGLSDETITSMLKEAVDCAQVDIKKRTLESKRLDGKQLEKAISQALLQDSFLIEEDKLPIIMKALGDLSTKLKGSQEDEIIQAIESLETLTDEFMRKRLDNSLKEIVSGKSLTQVNDIICPK